jgi:hypothetical protein
MNTLKVTKWEGFTLFCLVTLSILLALAGLWAARGFQARFSQVNPVQSEGKPMDVIMTGQKLAETAHNTLMGLGKYYLTGGAVALDPSGRRNRFASFAGDLANGGRLILTGGIAGIDPTNRGLFIRLGGAKTPDPTGTSRCRFASESSVADPVNGGHFILAGYARKVDNTGRLQG